MPSFYQGFGGFPFNPDDEGYLTFQSPLIGGREDVPWISMEDDFGDLVHGIFLNPMRWNRRTVQAVGDIVPFDQIVEIFTQSQFDSLPLCFLFHCRKCFEETLYRCLTISLQPSHRQKSPVHRI